VSEVWILDASPLIALGRVGQIGLLDALADQWWVPEAVAEEVAAGPDDPARQAVAARAKQQRPVVVPAELSEWGLGRGEGAVVALALEVRGVAILDDRAGRRCARAFAVPVIGTLGVIARAKLRGLLPAAAPLMRAVLAAGLYYDDDLVRRLLDRLGESWPPPGAPPLD